MTLTVAEIKELCAAGISVRFRPDGTLLSATVDGKPGPMTPAEKQKRYRESKKTVTEKVTLEPESVTFVTALPKIEVDGKTTPSSPAPSPFPTPLPFSPLHPPLTLSPPQTPSAPPPTPEFLDLKMKHSSEPKNPESDTIKLRLFAFFNRRICRRLDPKEEAAFRKANIQGEDIDAVEAWWMDDHREWDGANYRPRTMITLLNGWSAAVDKADDWKAFPPPQQPVRPIFSKSI